MGHLEPTGGKPAPPGPAPRGGVAHVWHWLHRIRPSHHRAHADERATLAHVTPDDVRALLDAIPTGLLLVDAEGVIVVANDAAMHLLGDPQGGLRGVPVHAVLPGCDRSGEQAAVQPDGHITHLGVATAPAQLGRTTGVLLVLTDVADLRRRDHEAARQRDEIAHLSRVAMLGELSGALAHELNQPLATILTNAQAAQRLLRARGAEAPQRVLDEILADIVSEDRRAGEVIQRLRKWLRKEHAEHVPLFVNEVVVDALHLVRNDLLHRGVDVQLELAGHLPAVDGDRILLQQVILNFVINGCDAMDGAPRPHLLRVRSRASEDGSVRVDVIDHGHGIDPAILPVMFEPFETTKPGGMGMGLAVCRNIIESHGGRVSARVVPEGGACVGFELPARAP